METLFTTLQFAFTSKSKAIKPNEIKVKLIIQDKIYELDDNNRIGFKPDYPSSLVNYGESIILFHNDKVLCTFNYLIHINKINFIIVDMDETKRPSFELFFYAKEEKYRPNSIKYKDVEFKQFMNYGNKFRSRIFFANVNPAELEYISSSILNEHSNKIKNNKTYQAIFRLINEKKFEVTLTDMACYINNYDDIKNEPLINAQFEELKNLLLKFSEYYLDFIYNNNNSTFKKQEIYQKLVNFSDKIESNCCYYFIESPNSNDYYNYDEKNLLCLFLNDLYLNEFIKLKEENKTPNNEEFEFIHKRIIKYHELGETLYSKLINDNNLNINQKVKIMKTITLFFRNTLLSNKQIFGINYLNMNKISSESPYFKSMKLLKDIISGLSEESRLFEAFLYFDSEVIENLLSENTQKNYTYKDTFGQKVQVIQPEFMTEYGISLMTVSEIKSHLEDLLPTIIIQIDTNINMRALYENQTKMMIINEYKMFSNNYNINESTIFKSEPDCYIIPIRWRYYMRC